jgi:hypothetical protein
VLLLTPGHQRLLSGTGIWWHRLPVIGIGIDYPTSRVRLHKLKYGLADARREVMVVNVLGHCEPLCRAVVAGLRSGHASILTDPLNSARARCLRYVRRVALVVRATPSEDRARFLREDRSGSKLLDHGSTAPGGHAIPDPVDGSQEVDSRFS